MKITSLLSRREMIRHEAINYEEHPLIAEIESLTRTDGSTLPYLIGVALEALGAKNVKESIADVVGGVFSGRTWRLADGDLQLIDIASLYLAMRMKEAFYTCKSQTDETRGWLEDQLFLWRNTIQIQAKSGTLPESDEEKRFAIIAARRQHKLWPLMQAAGISDYSAVALSVHCQISFETARDFMDGKSNWISRTRERVRLSLGCNILELPA